MEWSVGAPLRSHTRRCFPHRHAMTRLGLTWLRACVCSFYRPGCVRAWRCPLKADVGSGVGRDRPANQTCQPVTT
jgi:hypothetical protein